MKIGVTGTRNGATDFQIERIIDFFKSIADSSVHGLNQLQHGLGMAFMIDTIHRFDQSALLVDDEGRTHDFPFLDALFLDFLPNAVFLAQFTAGIGQ